MKFPRFFYEARTTGSRTGGGATAAPCALAQTPDGVWWSGTPRGVYRLTTGGAWELAGEQPGPLRSEVRGLVVAGATLWAGTSSGLWARRGAAWEQHPAGVAGNAEVRALAVADRPETLWLSAGGRVLLYDTAARAVRASYGPADSGLTGARVVALAEGAAALWAVTHSGISRLVGAGGS